MSPLLPHILEWVGLFALSFAVSIYATVVGGASIVLIPVLNLLGYPLVTAIASTRVASVVLESVGVVAFARKKAISWKPALWTALFTMPSAVVGAQIAKSIDPRILAYSVAVFLVFILILIVRLKKDQLKGNKHEHPAFYLLMALIAIILGVYGGFYGASFSTLIMICFVFFGGQDLFKASGNASLVTVFMSLSASISFFFAGQIQWNLTIPLVLGGVFGTWISVNLAYEKGFGWIRNLLAIVIVATIVKLIVAP